MSKKEKKFSAKRIKVEKEFGGGTLTKAAFFQMLRSALRQRSRFWKPINQVKDAAKRPNKSNNKKLKWQYQCKECEQWFRGDEVCVDHIEPAGQLNSFDDLGEFCKKLFCESDGLQVLCSNGTESCHHKKTQLEKQRLKIEKNNKNEGLDEGDANNNSV